MSHGHHPLSQLEKMIQKKVESGEYRDAGDVILTALALLERREKRDRLIALLEVAEQELSRGDYAVWTEDTMIEILREAKEADKMNLPISEHVKP